RPTPARMPHLRARAFSGRPSCPAGLRIPASPDAAAFFAACVGAARKVHSMRRILALSFFALGVGLVGWTSAADPIKEDKKGDLPPAAQSDVELVERNIAARKEYEASLKKLWEYYKRTGDKQRIKWVEEELMGFHLLHKPSYNLDVQDV